MKKKIWSFIKTFIIPIVVVYLICQFIICPVQVSGSSMYPTLIGSDNGKFLTGDYLLMLRKTVYNNYKQGDIVIASVPSFNDGEYIIKRVIATGGQTVRITHEEDSDVAHVYVDDVQLDEPYLNTAMYLYDAEDYTVTVPENSYFLMGDNRNASLDSRSSAIGCVSKDNIVGKAILLLIPGADGAESKRDWHRFGSIS